MSWEAIEGFGGKIPKNRWKEAREGESYAILFQFKMYLNKYIAVKFYKKILSVTFELNIFLKKSSFYKCGKLH